MSDREKMRAEIASFLATLPPSPWEKYSAGDLFHHGPQTSRMSLSDNSMLAAEREDAARQGRSVIHWD